MGIFSSIKDLFISSNKELISSHQNHMKNVEKSGIKVIEIQRKGTESTVVEIPTGTNSIYLAEAKRVALLLPRENQQPFISDLAPLVYDIVLWSFRDLQFYDEYIGKSPKFTKVKINVERGIFNLTILVGDDKDDSIKFEYKISYSNNAFSHSPEYLNGYLLPFEDVTFFNNFLSKYDKFLIKEPIDVSWSYIAVHVTTEKEKEFRYKGRYYIYDSSQGVLSRRGGQWHFLPYGREDWENLLNYAYHFLPEAKAKKFMEEELKPRIRENGGKVGDLQILSSARVYSEVQKLRNKSLNN